MIARLLAPFCGDAWVLLRRMCLQTEVATKTAGEKLTVAVDADPIDDPKLDKLDYTPTAAGERAAFKFFCPLCMCYLKGEAIILRSPVHSGWFV